MANVYVDTEAMASWKQEMEKINKDCIDNLDSIIKSMDSLNSSFQGDYAEKYEQSFGQDAKKVRSSHESMRDIENFLDTIVNVMNNQ